MAEIKNQNFSSCLIWHAMSPFVYFFSYNIDDNVSLKYYAFFCNITVTYTELKD